MDAIYARQSVDKQDSLSIEGQIALCQKFAAPDARLFADRGFSGKNTKRPAFQELLSAVEVGEIQKLFVYRLDRFSRSIADFSRLWELLEQHGVEFHSVTEHFDTASPMGRAMLNIVLVFAQLERETTAERVRDNYIHRFSLGAWPGGPAPYGYALTRTAESGHMLSTLIANEQSGTVRALFEAYAVPGASLRSVAREFTDRGIPGPRRQVWDNVTLSRILHSPVYVRADEEIYWFYQAQGLEIPQPPAAFDGVHACHLIGRRGRDTGHPPLLTVANHAGIIDASLWLRVQEKLSGNEQLPREHAGKYSWLTGLLKCARCGYAVKINRSRDGSLRLLCSGRSNLSSCDAVIHLDLKELEAQVAFALQSLLDSCPPPAAPCSGQQAAALLELETKIERLVAALSESSPAAVPYITRQIDLLTEKRQALLQTSSAPPAGIDFEHLSFDEKKLVAAAWIDRVLLEDTTATVLWRF